MKAFSSLTSTHIFKSLISKPTSSTPNSFRLISKRLVTNVTSSNSFFDVEIKSASANADKKFAILKLNKPPVNSLNLETLSLLTDQLESFENSPNLHGVILTSSVPGVFSAGVDIMEMYKCDVTRLEKFWIAMQNFWLKLYGSRKVYIAAINGHALAFGCVIAMSCDYRIMTNRETNKMGLNAVLLGIKAPFWFRDTMINTIGERECEKALQLAKIYNPVEALKVKLVDELANPDEILAQAEMQMNQWIGVPNIAREVTKQNMRKDTVARLISQRQMDVKDFIESTTDPLLQQNLENYLNSLKSRKNSSQLKS